MSLSLSVPAWPSGKGGREKPWTYSEMPISPPRSVCPEPAETPLAPRAHQPRTRLGGQLWRRAGWWRQGGFFLGGARFQKTSLCGRSVAVGLSWWKDERLWKHMRAKCSKPLLMTIGPYRVLVSIQYHPTYPGVNTIAGKSGLDQLPQVITPFSSSAAAVCSKAGDVPQPQSGAAQLHAGGMWKINISAQPCEVGDGSKFIPLRQ